MAMPRKLIPLTIYLTEDEIQMLLEQTRRDNEFNRQHVGEHLAGELQVQPDAVAAAALAMWLRGRQEREATR